MKWLFLPAFLSLAPLLDAASVQLTLKDGTTLEGEATLQPKSTLVFSNASVGTTNIDLVALRSARFHLDTSLAATSTVEAVTLPKPWTNADIGPVTMRGSVSWNDERVDVSGSGTNFWLPQADEFHFVFRPFAGNGHITAQITNSEAAIAGIMLRETLDPEAEFASQAASLGPEGLIFRCRRDRRYRELIHAEGESNNQPDIRPPCWLKLIRRDKYISVCQSVDDGLSWQIIHQTANTWDRNIYAGLFVVGGATNSLKTATFVNVQVQDESDGRKQATNGLSRIRVILNDGSALMTRQLSADQTKIRFRFGSSNVVGSVLSVSRIEFDTVPKRLQGELSGRRKGVLLKTGDFFEGELSSLNRSEVKLSSVLFGSRTFPGERVLGVTVSTTLPSAAPMTVRTLDGSLILAKSITSGPDLLLVEEPRFGLLAVSLAELASIETNIKPKL